VILIATPTMGRVCAEYLLSLLQATQELRAARIAYRIVIINGVSPIQFARNEAINLFHEVAEATHLLFVDDDMVFTAADIISLKAAEKPIVAALCPLRLAAAAYNAEPSTNAESDDELVTVNAVGTGFMMIERRVIDDMIESTAPLRMKSGVTRWPLFDCSVNDKGQYVSEDYTFCNRARAAGHKVWVHTALEIGHVGTHEFRPRHSASQRLELLKGAWAE